MKKYLQVQIINLINIKYYLAYIKNNNINDNNYQTSEVSNIRWCSTNECLDLIRPYSKEKKGYYTK